MYDKMHVSLCKSSPSYLRDLTSMNFGIPVPLDPESKMVSVWGIQGSVAQADLN